MGVHAADKLARIVDNVRNVLAIELLCAAQGVDLRAPHRPGAGARRRARGACARAWRSSTPIAWCHTDVDTVRALLDDGSIVGRRASHIELE